ncbi:hypothetical protein AGMMS50212_12860 [Spirochaetia bacterium]|nr:hypothetical protein AGMMS50212_12860 [Spirochaetia bacterium]
MSEIAGKSNFERLTSGLAQEDKYKLLEKIRANTALSEHPLHDEQDSPAAGENSNIQYARLPWYRKFLYLILGFFTNRSSMDVFVNAIVAEAGRSLELQYPGMYDYQQCVLKQDFQNELKKLKDAARFFYTALDSSVNRDAGAFFIFLGSIEMKSIHKALVEGTDPSIFAQEHPELSYSKITRMALNFIEKQLEEISIEQRNVMYQNTRSLLCLKQLSSFLFDRFILSFNQRKQDITPICPVGVVKAQLVQLNNILYSLKNTPSITLLSSMFVFIMQEHENEEGFDEDTEMQKFTSRAEKAIDVIRTFNRRVPIVRILRCAIRDMSYLPTELSGGEDWYTKYREAWIKNVTIQFNEFIKDRRMSQIEKLSKQLFNDYVLMPFNNVKVDYDDDGIPINGYKAVTSLLIFHKLIFMPEINIVLRPILINGEFVKAENRTEFTEAYNVLIKLDDTIKNLMDNISTGGDWGKRWGQIIQDVQSLTVRKRKFQMIQEEITTTVKTIIDEAVSSLIAMNSILTGLVTPIDGGKYDGLTNLTAIAGKGTVFMDGLNAGLEKLKAIIQLMEEIKAVEAMDN